MSSKKWWFLGGGAALFAFLMVFIALLLLCHFLPEIKSYSPVGKKIGILDVKGSIVSSEDTIEIIHDYRDDPTIAAVVIYIDSPGGGVAPSYEIYSELLGLKEKNKKVYAYMSNIGASGGYYIACAGDKIYSSPGTLTGSIGVILSFTNVEGLFGKIGLSSKVIKSGAYKDIGSPFRPMTPEEETLLGETVDDVYQQFLDVVIESRREVIAEKLVAEGVKEPTKYGVRRYVMEYADGRIFSGRQAYELGFVDELGNFEKCIADVAADIGVEGKPIIVKKRPKEESFYDVFFGRLNTVLFGVGEPATKVELKYSLY
jgi:protease-4